MASAFAELLIEARDRLRAKYREYVPLHFDWEPGASEGIQWTAWYADDDNYIRAFQGSAGEQALRNLVEQLRKDAD